MINPFVNTETDRLNQFIADKKMNQEEIIQEYINNHDTAEIQQGIDYYFKRNKITKRNIYKYDSMGNKTVDLEATNNKLASGWHKLLVDQKTAYLVGDPVTINSKNDDNKAVEMINDVLGDDFNDIMPELVKNASNKGIEWLHPYIDEQGNFDYMIIPAQEAIPIYDNTKRKELIGFIRLYELDDGTEKVEFWSDKEVTYYEYYNYQLVKDVNYEVNPAPHYYYGDTGYSWEKVPFIGFANNEERVSDLLFVKDYIDAYDNLTSDTTNTLEDIQDLFYILKGYEDEDLAEFSTNIRRYKAIKVSEEGGIDTAQAEVPMNSLDSFLNRLEENIFDQGMGVDVSSETFGGNASGVALKFLYSFLDMKASITERKFTKAINKFMWFVCEYLSIAENEQIDPNDITVTFHKSMIANQLEQVDMAQKSMGVISRETILEHHPFVRNVDTEKERIKQEQEETMVNLDLTGEDDE